MKTLLDAQQQDTELRHQGSTRYELGHQGSTFGSSGPGSPQNSMRCTKLASNFVPVPRLFGGSLLAGLIIRIHLLGAIPAGRHALVKIYSVYFSKA